jgi:hypothetical protein
MSKTRFILLTTLLLFPLFISIHVVAADDTWEPNNTMLDAKTLSLNSNYTFESDDIDWWNFTTTTSHTFIIAVNFSTSDGADLNLDLYNSLGSLVKSSYGSTGEEKITFLVADTLYYLAVSQPSTYISTNYTIIIRYNENPVFTSTPADQTLMVKGLGEQNLSVSWTITDVDYDPVGMDGSQADYILRVDGLTYSFEYWYIAPQNLAFDLSLLDEGYYEIQFEVFDGIDRTTWDTFYLRVINNIGPVINSSSNMTFIKSPTVRILNWTITDDMYNGSAVYDLSLNNTLQTEHSWISGDSIFYDITAFNPGIYMFNLSAFDGINGTSTVEIMITVLPNELPVLSAPADFNMTEGSNKSIDWIITDPNFRTNATITIYLNGVVQFYQTWILNDVIEFNMTITHIVSNLTAGIYNLTISVDDGFGISVSDTVIITITAIIDNSTDQSNNTSDENSTSNDNTIVGYPILPSFLVVGIMTLILLKKNRRRQDEREL